MSAAPNLEPEVTLSSLAREHLAKNGNDTEKAVKTLMARLRKDAGLLRALIEAALRSAIQYQVEHSMRSKRAAIIRAAGANPGPGRAGVIALAQGIAASYLDMPLANGRRLRDATRDEVTAQSDRYGAASRDMGHKSRFLRLIAQSVPGNRKVGEVITDARAAELWARADAADEAIPTPSPNLRAPRRRQSQQKGAN